jgi:hypothetical protein
LLPKTAKISRLVISANRRSGIRPRPGDGSGIHRRSTGCPAKSTDCPAKRSVLILRAILAAGRRRPDSASERPQAFRALAPRGSASVPAWESLALVLPVGPGRSFSARDPASPGVACSTLVPRRALLAARGRSGTRHPSQYPEAHRPSASSWPRAASESVPHGFNHAAVSLSPDAHGPSVPRARLVGA